MNPEDACARIHAAMRQLPQCVVPNANMPANGLYLHYEEGETNGHDHAPRIVRVGNHPRKQGGLRRRLNDHYAGRKNASVFRKSLGGALLRRANGADPCLAPAPGQGHWEKQNQAACSRCKPIERTVSAHLREHFLFRCVRIDDRSERNRFEQLLIATLVACPMCRASMAWLGRSAYNDVLRESGMWLSNHVGTTVMEEADLLRFEALVHRTPTTTL